MRLKRTGLILSFALVYAALLSFCAECFLTLAGAAAAVSIDADPTAQRPDGFSACCLAAGCAAFVLLVPAAVVNAGKSEAFGYTENTWIVQSALAFVLSIPMIKSWEMLREHLFRIFTA